MAKETIQDLLDRVADGNGYGDPEARLNDDRKLQALLACEMRESISQVKNELAAASTSSSKIGERLNLLTLLLVVVGLLNVAVLVVQFFK
jgi:hypothetical protein